MKKERIIKISVLTLVFILSVIGFNAYFSAQNEGATEMTKATLPTLGIRLGDYGVNPMHGYLGEVDAALLRDSITPVNAKGKITLELTDYDYDITAIYYQIYYGAASSLLEEGVLNKLSGEEVKTQDLVLKNALKEGEEYLIQFTIRLDSSRKVNYYSRLKYGTDFHYDESIAFALKLSDMMVEKKDTLNAYLETNVEMVNNNLAQVNIHSSFEAVTYAQSKPERESDTLITVKEINDDYTAIELRWLLSMNNGKGQTQYCDVVENYKVRYSPNRMYLLDYDRDMDGYYDSQILDQANNRIPLNTGLVENVTYIPSENNEKVSFVKNRQLWYYSYQDADITRVFSFQTDNLEDERNSYNQHNIHILNMDEDGNIDFIVYGYMNRGRHEGENGISLYHFTVAGSTISELAFIPTTIPYQNMEEDIQKFSYLNQDQIFYFLLDGTLYQVDTVSGEYEIKRMNLVNNTLTASSDNHIIAVQEKEDSTKNRKITLLNLENQKEVEITCDKTERIQSAGFVLTDFIYGIAKESDVSVTKGGTVLFPMEEIRIVDENGQEVKKYSKTGRYIIDTDVEGNVITLTYGKKSGNTYKESGEPEHIIYKEEDSGSSIAPEYGYDGLCYNQVYMGFPPYIYVQTIPDLRVAKEIISDNRHMINIDQGNMEVTQYLVYANGALVETCNTAYDAIQKAEEIRGLVVNNARQTIWESNIASYNQVIGLNMKKAGNASETYPACVSMIAALEGVEATLSEVKAVSDDKLEMLNAYANQSAVNLYGLTLSQVLYYVDKGTPVIAGIGGNHYVLIMSYNSTKVRYMDPLSGEEVVLSREEFEDKMKSTGNEYYSYIR